MSNGSQVVTTPLQGCFVICRLGLAIINLCTKFEVSTFTQYEDTKGNAKCRNWRGLGVRVTQGHRQHDNLTECIRLPIQL